MMRIRIGNTQIMLFIFFYSMTFRGAFSGGHMQNAVIDLTVAIVENRQFQIGDLHTNTSDAAYRQGRFYSGMAPGGSILAIPVYGCAKLIWRFAPASLHKKIERAARSHRARNKSNPAIKLYSLYLTPHYKEQRLTHALMTVIFGYLAGALGFYLLFRIAERLTPASREARHIALVYSIATVMLFYQAKYYTQSIAQLFMLLSIFTLFVRSAGGAAAFCGGFLAAVSGSVDYPYFLYGALVLVIWSVSRSRESHASSRLAAALAGYAIPTALTLLYHRICFGGWLETPYAFRASNQLHATGLLGLGWPRMDRLKALLISPYEGMLWLSPVCLLFPCGWVYFFLRGGTNHGSDIGVGERNPGPDRWLAGLMFLLATAAFFYFICIPWKSNMASYGPRFFLAALPGLVLFSYPYFRAMQWPFWILAFYSLAINHLNLIGVRPIERVQAALQGREFLGEGIDLFPYTFHFDLAKGTMVDGFYQGLIVLLAFSLPLIGSRFLQMIHILERNDPGRTEPHPLDE